MKTPLRFTILAIFLSGTTALQAASTIQFGSFNYAVAEDAGSVTLLVQRSDDTNTVVSVDYASTNGTATAGLKYSAVSGSLTFGAGETSKSIVVPILNEGFVEGTQNFLVMLSNPSSGAVLGGRGMTRVSITDNDQGLQFELGAYFVNEDDGEARIRVVRRDDGDFTVSVDYATSDLTASAGLDYVATTGTLAFAPGEVVKELIVPILNDAVHKPSRGFRVALMNPTGGGVLGAPKSATVIITDTDQIVQFGSSIYQTTEDAAFVRLAVVRGESQSAATVELTTEDYTAVAGVDYAGITNTLQFAQGERLKQVDIPVLNNGVKRSTATFRTRLSNPSGGDILGPRSGATVKITHNDPGTGFAQGAYTVWNGWAAANVNVLRGDDQLLGGFAVGYSTTDGSAHASVDYEAVSGTLEFRTNEMIRSLTIPLLPASTSGPTKSFTLILSNATGGLSLGTATTRITILNTFPGRSYPVRPSLDDSPQMAREQGVNILSWVGGGSLLRADQVTGPWQELAGAQSPYANRPVMPSGFYQIRSTRPTSVYVPSRYDGQTPMPLVMVLHGYGTDAAWMEDWFRARPLAESRGLLLCYPEGTLDSQGYRFWNATEACCDFYGAGIDDSAYLRSVIEEIVQHFAVDRNRIYVTGWSNGGYMSHRMACDHADLIAGIASVAGETFLDFNRHRPSQPVNVLQIQGTADEVVPYVGGYLQGLPQVAIFPGAVKTFQTWARLNGCQGAALDPTPSMDLDLAVLGLDATVMRYTNCPPGGAVELWTIKGGFHTATLTSGLTSSQLPEKLIDWLLVHPKP